MKKLKEFETLQEARGYEHVQGKIIPRSIMNAWLSGVGKYRRVKEIAQDETHPLADGAAAFLDSEEYNLISTSSVGQEITQLVQSLVESEGNDAGLQSVLDKAVSTANPITYPYRNVSEYEWRKAREETIDKKAITPVNGWLKITLRRNVEEHRPTVYAEVQGVMKAITLFGKVSSTGDYLAEVPKKYSLLYVDDFYKAI